MKESYLADAVDTLVIRRVLVIMLRHHGDVLLTSPLFTVLKKRIPGVECDALVYKETLPMLQHHPDINQLHSIDRSWKRQGLRVQWENERGLMRRLRERRYDLVIHLTDHLRGARIVCKVSPRYSVAQHYPDRRGRWWRRVFSHVYHVPKTPRHKVEQNLDALRRLGIYPHGLDKRLVLKAGDEAQCRVERLLHAHGLQAAHYIVVHPTSRWQFKGWSSSHFADVIDALYRQDRPVVITSSPEQYERDIVREIVRSVSRPVVDLSGQLGLNELTALIDQAQCLVGLDSVPVHMAAAVQTPCVVLFGPSDERVWGPWQVPHRVISRAYSCRPCGMDGCGNSKISDCIMGITPEQVIRAVEDLTQSEA